MFANAIVIIGFPENLAAAEANLAAKRVRLSITCR